MSIAVSPALTNNTTFYKYEPFVYTFTGGSSFSVSGSSILTAFCTVSTSNVVFASVNGFQSTGSTTGEALVVKSSIGSNAYTFFVSAGRFASQLAPVVAIPTSLSLFIGESTTIPFYPAPGGTVTVTTAYQTPTLPIGLSFNNVSTNWVLTGIPRLVSATSNYLFVGSNLLGQVVSSSMTIGVAAERMTLTASSSSQTLITSPATAITPITLSNGAGNSSLVTNVVFTLPTLPIGLNYYSNAFPNLITSSILTAPIGTSVVIAGTPTTSNVTTSNVSVVITTSGVSASQTTLSASSTISFTYSPAVLFTLPVQTSNILYVGVPVSNTLATTYGLQLSAYTAFSPTVQPVTSYYPTSILPGVNIISNSSGWFISGTPTSAGDLSLTIYAANAAGIVGSNVLSFSVRDPVINVSATSGLQSFVVGRALSNSFTYSSGSYVYPITYSITSPAYQTTGWLASNNLSFSNLPVGVSTTLAPVGAGYQVTLIGTPTAVTSAAQLTLTATVGAVLGLGSVVALVNPDVFTFSTPTPMPFVFSQNIPITPIQMFVSTLSETPVLYFTGEGLPTGLSITSTGSLQGTPLVATTTTGYLTFSATNGYTTATPLSTQFPYSTLSDTANISPSSTTLTAGVLATIPLTIRTQSGVNVTNISSSNYAYGLTFAGTSISGTPRPGQWPDAVMQQTSLTVLCSNTVGGIPSVGRTFVYITPCNSQNLVRYISGFSSGTCTVYSSSNSFAFSPVFSVSGVFSQLQHSTLNNYSLATRTTSLAGPGGLPSSFSALIGGAPSSVGCIYATSLARYFTLQSDLYTMLTTSDVGTGSYTSFMSGVTITARADGSCVFRWLPRSIDPFTSNANTTGGFRSGPACSILLGGVGGLQYGNLVYDKVYQATQVMSNSTCILTTVNDVSVLGGSTLIAVGIGSSGNTIQYSTDGVGAVWTTASNGFNISGANVVWGGYSNATSGFVSLGWMATGLNTGNIPSLKYSSNGITWLDIAFPFTASTVLGPLQFDGINWNVFVDKTSMYVHDILTSRLQIQPRGRYLP